MPTYNQDDEMYSDEPAAAKATAQTEESEKPAKTSEPAAVLPRSILAGKEFNVGDELVLKITAMHEDQIEVEYASSESDQESKEGQGEMERYRGGDSEMQSMME